MEIDKIYTGDNIELIKKVPDDFIDLTVTSPPYGNLRDYKGKPEWDFPGLAKELFRVTKPGGVVVWVVGDMVVDGSETGDSFRQALHFMECGFSLYDTMIYHKNSISIPTTGRYYACFEYMFVMSKGVPKTINLISDRKNKRFGERQSGTERNVDGSTRLSHGHGKKYKEFGVRFNVWKYGTGYMKSTTDKQAYKHPAIFPDALARDHILSWSNRGDIVLDPFAGSGTTLKMAMENGRHWLGFEISQEYADIAESRLRQIPLGL